MLTVQLLTPSFFRHMNCVRYVEIRRTRTDFLNYVAPQVCIQDSMLTGPTLELPVPFSMCLYTAFG